MEPNVHPVIEFAFSAILSDDELDTLQSVTDARGMAETRQTDHSPQSIQGLIQRSVPYRSCFPKQISFYTMHNICICMHIISSMHIS